MSAEDGAAKSPAAAAASSGVGLGPLPLTATLDELVHLLLAVDLTTGRSPADLDFRRAFLLNHHLFASTDEVVLALEHAFSAALPITVSGMLARVNVLYVLCDWAEWFPADLISATTGRCVRVSVCVVCALAT